MRYSFFIFLLLGLVCPAAADDAAVYCDGGTVKLIKPEHSSVRMLWERVYAKLTSGDDSGYGARVRCEFVFKNEGPAITLQMGFPEIGGGSDEDSFAASQMLSFKSWVDGVPTATRYVRERKGYGDYSAWHVKNVHFNPGQTVRVTDEYVTPYHDQSPQLLFNYILRSGSSWKGKIGKAKITVDTSAVTQDFEHCSVWPSGYRHNAHRYTWVLRDFEPREDICIRLIDGPLINRCRMELRNLKIKQGTTVFASNDDFGWLGAKGMARIHVDRKPGSKTCVVRCEDKYVRLTAGSRTAASSTRKVMRLPIAPYIDDNDNLWMPLIALREVGMNISYDKKNWDVVAKLPAIPKSSKHALKH